MDMDLMGMVERLRKANPLVHHITNYVTVNDCANMTLAIGASPVMADDIHEAAHMTAISQALVINIGTLNSHTVMSMVEAGKKAAELGIPVVLDPVGCGATPFRTETAKEILETVRPNVVRGNVSEIGSLLGWSMKARGVDAARADVGQDGKALARMAAREWGSVVAVTGAMDMVSDGARTFAVRNGCPAMARITGTGCMCTSVTASFCAALPEDLCRASLTALVFMGLCGERAWEEAGQRGLGSFHTALFGVAGRMTDEDLVKGARYEEV